jgi:hypothetical protein
MKSTCLLSKELDFAGLNITTVTDGDGAGDERRELQIIIL